MDISKKFLSKEKLDCSLLCAEPFASFRADGTKRREKNDMKRNINPKKQG